MARKAKHKVAIVNNRGKIRLYWRYNAQPYYASPSLNYDPENIKLSKEVALTIEKDMKLGRFDASLTKYNAEFKELIEAKNDTETPIVAETIIHPIIKDFENWTENFRHKSCEKDVDYHSTRNMMRRWKQFNLKNMVQKLNKETFSADTYNRRLKMLQSFLDWGVNIRGYAFNPMKDVAFKQFKHKPNPKRAPFTNEEIKKILDAIKNDTFNSKYSSYKHSFYYPFIYFIFKTGVRNAEAVGLRVKHINIEKKIVTIEEVMARVLGKSYGSARIRKETKNGKVRDIPIDDELIAILKPQIEGKEPDDLVFKSYTGQAINDEMFQNNVLKPVLKALNIPPRNLYAARHSAHSRCLASGISPVTVAFIMGNNPETALRHYTHVQELPESLPSF